MALLGALAAVDEPSGWRSLRALQLGAEADAAADADAGASALASRVLRLLGSRLSPADALRVEFGDQRRHSRCWLPGEVVAVAGAEGALRYARVAEDSEAEGAELCGSDVKVQVSRACIRWVPASQLRFFPAALDEPAGDRQLSFQDPEVDTAPPGEDVVGAANVAAAVNALLARLNLSLGASHAQMLAEMQSLSVRAALAEENHRAALRRIDALLRDKHAAQKLVACAVCMDRGIDCALVPCGHVFCAGCVQRLQPAACPVCRQEFTHSAAVRLP